MSYIGLHQDHRTVIEGTLGSGRIVVPPPYTCLATVVLTASDISKVPADDDLFKAKLIFREDSFDAATRVRRGRLYASGGNQPTRWHTVHGLVEPSGGHQFMTFQSQYWSNVAGGAPHARTMLALGTADAYSLWDVIHVEKATHREFLITMRAQSSFVRVTSSIETAVPARYSESLQASIDAAVDANLRLDPNATIDHCRSAVTIAVGGCLSPILGEQSMKMELGALEKELAKLKDPPSTVVLAIQLLRRFHSRTKPNELRKFNGRPNTSADGDLAIATLDLILRELSGPISSHS